MRGNLILEAQPLRNGRDEALMGDPVDEAEVTRGDRFIKTAVAILGETGRTDFTVQEVVARSKTSLRAFYQHFSSKDELLLALFDRTIAQSAQTWRAETTGLDSTAALKLVIDRISQQPESSTQDSLNRALSLYNQHLAETRPREYARVLSPLHQLIRDIVGQGITEGVFNPGLDVGAAAAIVMQTMVGAQRLHWLGSELNGTPIDAGQLYDFCSRALGIRDTDDESAAPSLAELFAQIGMRPGTHDGEFAMTMPVSPQVVNTSGALQGGLIATLVDVAGGQFGLEHLQPGTTMTTADLFVRYLRPIRQGSARAVPRMLRSGRRAMVMQVDIYGDGDETRRDGDREFRHHQRNDTDGRPPGRRPRPGTPWGAKVVTSLPPTENPRLPQGDRHAVARAFLPRVRRRQPHVRTAGGADQVPPGQAQERDRLRPGPRSHQDRGARPHQRVHPQPDVRSGGPPGRAGGLLPARRAGKSYREILGEPMKAIPAFREPGPRLEVMDELGIDYALMFPTLASLVEERMKDDPEMTHDVIHALNQWMYEHVDVQLPGAHLRHPGDHPAHRRARA